MSKGNRRSKDPTRIQENKTLYTNVVELNSERSRIVTREEVYDYIESLTTQLTLMAMEADGEFLAYLLSMAADEAKSSKAQLRAGMQVSAA